MNYQNLINKINKGSYNDWAIQYIKDINNDQDIRDIDCKIDEVLNPVKDFLACREIEENDEKNKKPTTKQIKSYLIDCIGYSANDLDEMNEQQMMELVNNTEDMQKYTKTL